MYPSIESRRIHIFDSIQFSEDIIKSVCQCNNLCNTKIFLFIWIGNSVIRFYSTIIFSVIKPSLKYRLNIYIPLGNSEISKALVFNRPCLMVVPLISQN
jgi:hypothetical protein